MHIHRTRSYLYIVLEKEEDVSASKREDDVSIWKREDNVSSWKREEGVSTWKRQVHVSIWKRDEIVQTKCKRSQSTVPNLLSSHHWQKANNQIHCTRSAHITSLTKSKQSQTTVPNLLTSHHWQKANKKTMTLRFFPKLQLLLVCVLTALAWCHMKLLPSWRVFCVHHTTMRCVT